MDVRFMFDQRHVYSFSLCQKFEHWETKILDANITAILLLVMVFGSLVRSFSKQRAKTDVTEKIANLNVVLF